MSIIQMIISFVLVVLMFNLIEVSIALLMGYRYRVFLTTIFGLNFLTLLPFEIYIIMNWNGIPMVQAIVALILFIGFEYLILKTIFKERYTHKELLILVSIMNTVSLVLVIFLRQFI